jgi:signal peptidase I
MELEKVDARPTLNGTTGKKVSKQPLVASILSFVCPGAGQASNGDLKGAVYWGVTPPAVAFISSSLRLVATFLGFISCIALQLLIVAFSARSAFRYSKRQARTIGSSSMWWLKSFGAAALTVIIVGTLDYAAISSATIRFYKVTGGSMVPTIAVGDRIAADLSYYHHHAFERGEVVALKLPNGLSPVKRIAALGGDVVEGKDGRVFVNGKPFDDRHRVDVRSIAAGEKWLAEFGPETVPPGKCFVLGDNRGHSWDSRAPDFGPVDQADIKGKVLYYYWSSDHSRIGKRVE